MKKRFLIVVTSILGVIFLPHYLGYYVNLIDTIPDFGSLKYWFNGFMYLGMLVLLLGAIYLIWMIVYSAYAWIRYGDQEDSQ